MTNNTQRSNECKCEMPNTDLSGRCFKCGGNLIFPNNATNNTQPQLPAEVVADIHAKADAYINSSEEEGTEWAAYVNGATEYATKLLACDKANSALEEKNRGLIEQNNEWKEECDRLAIPCWVKASEFKHEVGVAYHAKDSRFKGAGVFSPEGNFKWGDGTITFPRDQADLYILDEAGPSYAALKAKCERMERGLNKIVGFPDNQWHGKAIRKIATEALAGDGEKPRLGDAIQNYLNQKEDQQ